MRWSLWKFRRQPIKPQYGRFSGGLTSVQTKAPQDKWNWELNDFLPSMRFRSGHMVGVEDDSPRLSFTGPLYKDKLTFSEYTVYDINKQPVRGLAWPHNEIKKQGFDSFTDLYYVNSTAKPADRELEDISVARAIRRISTLSSQQPASSDYAQSGFSMGATDRYMFTSGGLLTTLFQYTDFDSYAHGQGSQDMILTVDNWDGNWFDAWTRAGRQQEFLQNYQSARLRIGPAATRSRQAGILIHRSYNDNSKSHPVQLVRPDGSLAELITFQGAGALSARRHGSVRFRPGPLGLQRPPGARLWSALFRPDSGHRYTAFAPRLGLVYSPGQSAKTIIRSGVGLFYDRVPLLAGDFTQNLTRA